jgi:hypothetical protein
MTIGAGAVGVAVTSWTTMIGSGVEPQAAAKTIRTTADRARVSQVQRRSIVEISSMESRDKS